MKLRDIKTVQERRTYIEDATGVSLKAIAVTSLDEQVASSKHCENMIGTTHVPLGIAGPLTIRSSTFERKNLYVPLATTEGALVASVSRGCKALTESGGAIVSSERIGVTRGSVFKIVMLPIPFAAWFAKKFDQLKSEAALTSSHLTLLRYDLRQVGRYIFVRWYFDSEDAMGMNMATIAADALARMIERETGLSCLATAGNYDSDKKPSWLNSINGRGREVRAEVVVPQEVVATVLKVVPGEIEEVWRAKCMLGSALAGSLGYNAQYANIIAALFIATGQDPAHVVEGSQGITTVEVQKNGDLYCSIYMPSLMVGTVGGGTHLATQAAALKIIDCEGAGTADRFAGIVAGTVLAGELSLLASLAEGSLARAHKKLAR